MIAKGIYVFQALQLLVLLASLCKGHVAAQSRIVGGSYADSAQYPYFTTLYRNEIRVSEFSCGGSLIAPDVVLSAAHCIDSNVPINYAFVNNTDHRGTNPYGYVRTVVDIIVHPDWDPINLWNDLVLLILDEPVNVKPIAYSRQFPVMSSLDTLRIMGFGRLENGGVLPDTLQQAKVDLADFGDCDDAYSKGGILDFLTGLKESSQFCASGPGIDSCQGDSGGPLILSSSSDTVADLQLGVVSFGRGCAQAEFPGVYTRLSTFADWIDENVCEKSSYAPSFCPSAQTPSNGDDATGRNVCISTSGLTVATDSHQGLEIIKFGETDSATVRLPNGVTSFDDLSIADNFVFALDVSKKTVCTYLIAVDTNELYVQSCYQGYSWNVGAFSGISCLQGVCVIAQGEEGMTILNYDTTTGAIVGSPRIANLSFDNVNAFVDVQLISSKVAAMSTHFRNGINVFRPRYGTMLVHLETLENLDDTFRIRQNALRGSYAVEPTNFALVNAVYHDTMRSRTYLYTAHGGMTVQDVNDSGSTNEILDSALDGNFRAVTVAVESNNGIAVFGGIVQEDGRHYVMVFDLKYDPTRPTLIGLFQIPFRIMSIAIRDFAVAVVGSDSQILDLTDTSTVKDSFVSGSFISDGDFDESERPASSGGSGEITDDTFESNDDILYSSSASGIVALKLNLFLVGPVLALISMCCY